jgi:predicted SAM-dependent methyltransferase
MAQLPDPMPRRINVGCGYDVRPGYLNVDFVARHNPDLLADVTSLPMLPSGYFDEVVANDVLEHIERTKTDAVLTEWARLLAPNGIMRLGVPSLLHLADLALSPGYRDAEHANGIIHLMFGTQAYTGDFHFTSFTPATLHAHLHRAGLFVRSVDLRDGWVYDVGASRVAPSGTVDWPAVPTMDRLDMFEHLNHRLDMLEQLNRSMLASTSWRLTAPLRWLATGARTLFHR